MKTYLYLGLAVLLIAFGSWVYALYTDNQRLELEKATLTQNQLALQDSLSAEADSLTILTASVRNLNVDVKDKDAAYVALRSKYDVAIQAINSQGHAITVVSDSTDTTKFNGKQGIVSFAGFTTVNHKTQLSSYSLSLAFDVINAGSELVEMDGIWKIKTYSLTDGVDVLGYSSIDDATFAKLRGVQIVPQTTFWSHIHFGIGISTSYIGDKFVIFPAVSLIYGW